MPVARGGSILTRLLILWLLSEAPLHGYRIKKILDDESLRFWFPIEVGSIYAVLRSLVKGSFVTVVAVEREGQRPERTRYAITREGREHLTELLARAWRELPSPADPFQLALAARSELTEAEVERLLAERIDALRDRTAALEQLARSAPALAMVERQRALTRAELEWAEVYFTEGGGGSDGR
jgi:DNA-binding PadR family transcriptional regulator